MISKKPNMPPTIESLLVKGSADNMNGLSISRLKAKLK